MSARWMLALEAQDKPGIVANVAESLAKTGCNLADVSMTRLSGVFVMLAVVVAPDDAEPDELMNVQEFPGNVSWRQITSDMRAPEAVAGNSWNVTVYGSDKPGIVAAITNALAHNGVNINDLSTRLVDDEAAPTYTMLIDATVPGDVDGEQLRSELYDIAERLGVTCHATPVDIDTL